MADRSVKVTIGANVSPLKAAMADGAKSVEGLGGTVTTLGQKIKSGLTFVGVTGGIVSLGAAIKGTFTLGLTFTQQLNDLQAVTQATGDQMARVSATARQLGNDVEIPATSAADAAEAMTELAKGGLSVQQSMDAAKGTLQLAAAAQVSGAEAATIQANALNTFGLSASDAGHVADVLANTANAASGEITDFAQAMQQSGSVAKLFGISVEDTSTALGIFAKNGVLGSDAGTSLKSMLTQLATPSDKAKKAMAELGLTIYDNQGRFVGLRALTGQLADAQGRMSQAAFQSAAGILFGSDAIRAASILASTGVDAYDDFRAAVDRAGGAADLANAKMQGLPGALQQAENAIQDVALEIYDRLAPATEEIVRGFSDAIPKAAGVVVPVLSTVFTVLGVGVKVLSTAADIFGALPGPVQAFGVALVGLAIAQKIGLISSLSSAFDTLRLRAMYAGDAIRGMSFASMASGARAAGASVLSAFGGPWVVGIAAAATAVTLLGQAWADSNKPIVAANDLLDINTGKLNENAQATMARELAQKGYLTVAAAAGVSEGDLTNAFLGNAAAAARVTEKVKAYAKGLSDDLPAAVKNDPTRNFWAQQSGDMGKSMSLLKDMGVQSTETTKKQGELAQAAAEASAATADGADAAGEYSDSWNRAAGAMSAAGGVAAATASDVDGLSGAVKDQVGALLDLLNVAAQTRSALSSSITGFVSPVNAYQAATQKANARPSGGGGGGGGRRTDPLVDAASKLVEQAKKDRDAIDQRYKDILDVTKARYDEQLSAWEKARDAVKAAADEAQRSAEAFLKNSQDRATAAKDEASALSDLAGFGSGGSTLASALEAQAVAQAKLNVAKDQQAKIEKQLSGTSDPKRRAELQDRLNTLIAQQSSLQAVAAAADKDAADARAELAANTDLSTAAAQRALDAMQRQATAAAEVIGKDQEAADTAETSAARKTKADDDYASHKEAVDAALKTLQDRADAANKAATDKYETLLAAKNAAEEKSKASSVGHGAGVSGAAAKMAQDAAPSFQQYMDELRKQVEAQQRWKDNIISLASRVGPEIAIELAKMGPEAAPMIQMLANQTDEKLNNEWVPLFKKSTAQGTQDILDELTKALDPTGEKGLQLGNKVIDKLTEALKAAKDDPTAQAAILAVIDALQTTATNNPINLTVYPQLDQAKLNQQMANAFGAGYNPATFWGQGSAANRAPGLKNGGWIPGAASGEWISGGIPGQDSVLRWLMPGEAVIPTANAQANKPVVDALIAGRPIVMPQSDNGALVAEVRALRAETARLTSVVASSSQENARVVVSGMADRDDRDLLKSRKRSL